jgi:hypothetical protein
MSKISHASWKIQFKQLGWLIIISHENVQYKTLFLHFTKKKKEMNMPRSV